jgi:iron complex transport system ATP-binding protein
MYIKTENLTVGYRTGKKVFPILKNLNLTLKQGLTVLIGLNGSGKSTLLKSLANLLPPLEGKIVVSGTEVGAKTDLSRKISLVTTEKFSDLRFSVHEIVAFGRYPHLDWTLKMSEKDKKIINDALAAVDCLEYSEKNIGELSDGQFQKVMLARALAQDTPICLLDEATAHLDVINRSETAFYLRKISRDTQKAILLSTHDLETGLQAADEVWLIDKDGNLHCGSPEDLVLKGFFAKIFSGKNLFFNSSDGNVYFKQNLVPKKKFTLKGNETGIFWLTKALEKQNYGIEATSENIIEVQKIGDDFIFSAPDGEVFHTTSALLKKLNANEDLLVRI